MKIGDYNFEFKKFEFSERMSDETNCFSADLYVNGKKFAFCRNHGHGGNTDVDIYPECREFAKEVEAFLAKQPKTKSEHFDFEYDVDLESIADDLCVEKLEERALKSLMKKTNKNLVFKRKDGEYFYFNYQGNPTIASMLERENGREAIRKSIARELGKGHTLINENIPAELLPKI